MSLQDMLPRMGQDESWIDAIAEGAGCHPVAAAQLLARHRRYYAQRVPEFMALPGDKAWWGECPMCAQLFAIDGLTGWWLCTGCSAQGEMVTLEYMLHGQDNPARWAACRQTAEALMASKLSDPQTIGVLMASQVTRGIAG